LSSRCPSCGAKVEHPEGGPGRPGQATHATRDCPACHAPLIFFGDADFREAWRINTREQRRRGGS